MIYLHPNHLSLCSGDQVSHVQFKAHVTSPPQPTSHSALSPFPSSQGFVSSIILTTLLPQSRHQFPVQDMEPQHAELSQGKFQRHIK